MGHFLYNSLSKSLKYDTWLLGAISITSPYQNHWNMTYKCSGQFPVQFLIKIIEIWHLAARGNFHYNSLSKSLKYDLWPLQAISCKILYQINEVWDLAAKDNFFYNSLSKSLTYDLWLQWAISFRIPYQINEIWELAAKGNFLYNPLPTSLKYDLWLLWAISFTIP